MQFCVAFMVIVSGLALDIPKFPNIGYLGKGYDIMYGNPHSTADSVDPGFRSNIFDLSDYSNSKTTADGRYQIPYGSQVDACDKCSTSFASTFTTGVQSYANALSQEVEVDASGWFSKFSASHDYTDIEATTRENSNVITESSAECCAYTGSLHQFAVPKLDEDFQAGVQKMPLSFDNSSHFWEEFIGENGFGTHAVHKIDMGGRFGVQSNVANAKWSWLASSAVDLKVAVSVSAFGFGAGTSTLDAKQKAEAEMFNSQVSSRKTYSVGGKFPQDGKAESWMSSVKDNPMPMHLQLVSIEEFLTSDYFPNDANISSKRKALTDALNAYCESLKVRGHVSECKPPGNDPPFPPATTFGGLYTVTDNNLYTFKNPYTNGLNCPTGFNPHQVGRMMHEMAKSGANVFVCLSSTTKDPLGVFGGMGQVSTSGPNQYKNPMTNDYNCPQDYDKVSTAYVIQADTYFGAEQFMCLKKGDREDTNPIGGAIQWPVGGTTKTVNSYTHALSCPPGYQAYQFGNSQDGFNVAYGNVLSICLNNVPKDSSTNRDQTLLV